MHGTARATVDLYRYVVGLASAGLDNLVCFTELIDNSLDAQAKLVRISIKNGRELRLSDNGTGVPDVEQLVCFGGHLSHRSTRSGVYGVGFKDAVLCLGGETAKVKVSTRCGTKITLCTIDWQRLRESAECMEWDSDEDANAKAGTDIVIQPLRQKFPEGKLRDRFLEHLGYIYSPAIKGGAEIQVTVAGKTVTVDRWELPKLEEVVDEAIDIGGRRARLYAGIVAPGQANEHPGLTYSHGFRVVKRASRAGCGAWNHTRVCGIVVLDERKSWARTKNKTDLVDADDLYEEIERRLTPLLRKVATQSHSLEIEGSRAALEALLSSAILGAPTEKAKRGDGDVAGTKTPTGKGGRHSKAKDTQAGATFGRRRVSTLRLFFRPGWSSGKSFGEWEAVKAVGCVTLFDDHPLIRNAIVSTPWNYPALFVAIGAVVSASHNGTSSEQGSLVSSHDVLTKLAEFTAKAASIDGQALAESFAQAAE